MSNRTWMSLTLAGLAMLLAGCQPAGSGTDTYLAEGFDLPFPLAVADDNQLEAARDCAAGVESLANELYPESMSLEAVEAVDIPDDDCHRAALALALAARQEDAQLMPDILMTPWVEMVKSNPAMALVDPVFYAYLGAPAVISPPEWAGDPLEQISLRYAWFGMGDEIDYEILITPSEQGYAVEGQINGEPVMTTVQNGLVQSLTDALSGLLPVGQAAKLVVCMDNYPSWQIELIYSDGRIVDLSTAESNIFFMGGPWYANIDEQVYLQVSGGLVEAVRQIVDALSLPVGEPLGMSCDNISGLIMDRVFPGEDN